LAKIKKRDIQETPDEFAVGNTSRRFTRTKFPARLVLFRGRPAKLY
jgi:hypothetical protein